MVWLPDDGKSLSMFSRFNI